MLRPDERSQLLMYCNNHVIVVCPRCAERLTFQQIGADPLGGRQDFCPTCRADVTAAVRQHIAECTVARAQQAARAPRQIAGA